MIPKRFSLLTLLVLVTVLGALFAYFERNTREDISQTRISTELIMAGQPEVSREVYGWLDSLGFQPVPNPPLSVQGVDLFGDPYRNFYVGSYKGSRRFYVSVNPDWTPVDRPDYGPASNVLICVVAEFTARSWQVQLESDRLDRFVNDFGIWAEELRVKLEP
jgi:hypothetical protein